MTVKNVGNTIFSYFDIEFDAGTEPNFNGGDHVTGNLRINLNEKMIIDKIRIQFKGHSVYAATATNKDKQEKVYFDIKLVLLERPPGQPEAGPFLWKDNFLYTLPFEFYLPVGLPTTYENPAGYIRYIATALLTTGPENKTCYSVKKPFTIIEPIAAKLQQQLISDASSELPTKASGIWKYKTCCSKAGKVMAEVELPKNVYSPGERIFGTITVNNQNSKKITELLKIGLVDRVNLINQSNGINTNITTTTTTTETPKNKKKKDSASLKIKKDSTLSTKKSSHFDHRVILMNNLEPNDNQTNIEKEIKAKKIVTYENIYFFTVPSIPPTPHYDEQQQLYTSINYGSLPKDGKFSQIMESPSTSTLKAIREPFITYEYSVMVRIPPELIIEIPIHIAPIDLNSNGVVLKPFAGGNVQICEDSDSDFIAICPLDHCYGRPYSYTPKYPTMTEFPLIQSQKQQQEKIVENNEIRPNTNEIKIDKKINNDEKIDNNQSNIEKINKTSIINKNEVPFINKEKIVIIRDYVQADPQTTLLSSSTNNNNSNNNEITESNIQIVFTAAEPQVIITDENGAEKIHYEVEEMNNEVEILANKLDEINNKAEYINNEIDDLANKAETINNKVDGLANEAEIINNEVDGLANETEIINNEIEGLANEEEKINNEVEEINNEIDGLANEAEVINNEVGEQHKNDFEKHNKVVMENGDISYKKNIDSDKNAQNVESFESTKKNTLTNNNHGIST